MPGAIALCAAGAIWRSVARFARVSHDPGVWLTVLFASALLAYALALTKGRDATVSADDTSEVTASPLTAFVVAFLLGLTAILVYERALRVGLLADDFTLLNWARERRWLPSNWEYARPLPLVLWWIVALVTPVEDVAARIHLLNVLAHALNAWLVWRLSQRLGTSKGSSVLAAGLFLLSPVAVEPVTWLSAMSDVLLTTLALALCLVLTRRRDLRVSEQLVCLLLGMLMIAAKETGVVAAPLALLVRWTRWGSPGRAGYAVAGGLALVAMLYAGGRALAGRLDPDLAPVPDLESLRRLVTQSFGALSVPLHAEVIRSHPLAAAAVPSALILLLTLWAWRWPQAPRHARLAILAAASLVVIVAPTIRPFGVLDDLQGSRYVYLPAAFWTIALGSALVDGWPSRAARLLGTGAALVALAGAPLAVEAHLAPWRRATRVRDLVVLRLVSMPPSCVRVYAGGVPDNVAGAYVFRNGLTEAVASAGRSYEFVREDQAPGECRIDLTDVSNPKPNSQIPTPKSETLPQTRMTNQPSAAEDAETPRTRDERPKSSLRLRASSARGRGRPKTQRPTR